MAPHPPSPGGRARAWAAATALGLGLLALAPGGQAAATATCLAAPASLQRSPTGTWQLGHGVTVRARRGVNHRGQVVQLTVVSADVSQVRLGVSSGSRLGEAAPTTELTTRAGGLVGVNGDYFSYDRAGAAVTYGAQVRAGTVQRVPAGWTRFVGVDAAGHLRTGLLHATGTVTLPPNPTAKPPVKQAKVLPVVAVNAEVLPTNGVTVVTSYRDLARPTAAWEVVVRRGIAVWAGRRADYGPGRPYSGHDLLLAGTGTAGTALRSVRPGQAIGLRFAAAAADGAVLREAIGSGKEMMSGGRIVATCDGAGQRSRARMLVAWDASGRHLWLLAVDSGGASFPVGGPGLTYHESTELAQRLGATEAVMVDGGGSTTVAIRPAGHAAVRVDAPSWATQRPVPDGLVLIPS